VRGDLLVAARFVGIFVGIVRAHGDDTNMLNDRIEVARARITEAERRALTEQISMNGLPGEQPWS
jgi:hypothetical protein